MARKKAKPVEEKSESVAVKDNANRRVYTPEEIQEILQIGKNSTYDLVKSGAFHCVKIGGHYRVSKKIFDKWLEGTTLSEGDNANEE